MTKLRDDEAMSSSSKFEPELNYPRPWLRGVVIASVLLVVVIVVVLWGSGVLPRFGGSNETAAPSPTTTQPTESPTSSDGARVANGCLGGQAVNAQTVLLAQDQAPLDDVGAAEFAATINRWGGTSETSGPAAREVDTVLDAITAPNATESVTSLRDAEFAAEREGQPPSTARGGYYIESSTDNEVVVSVLLVAREATDADGDPMGYSATFTLDRSSGEWLLVDQRGTRDPNDLNDIMTPFAGGC